LEDLKIRTSAGPVTNTYLQHIYDTNDQVREPCVGDAFCLCQICHQKCSYTNNHQKLEVSH